MTHRRLAAARRFALVVAVVAVIAVIAPAIPASHAATAGPDAPRAGAVPAARESVPPRAAVPATRESVPPRAAVPASLAPGGTLEIHGSDGARITAVLDERRALSPARTVLTGHVTSRPGGRVVLAGRDGTLHGQLSFDDGTRHRLRFDPASGALLAEPLDGIDLPPCAAVNGAAGAHPDGAPGGTAGGSASCDDGSVVDVLALYTPLARAAAGGTAAIEAEIDLAVALGNEAYDLSQVAPRIYLVGVEEIAYDEAGTYLEHLVRLTDPDDGIMDDAHARRNEVGADLVTLVVADNELCGTAWVMTNVSTDFAPSGFSVVTWFCAAENLSLVHELSHNMGCHHDRADTPAPGAFEFSHGHRFVGNTLGLLRTIMAVGSGGRIQRFSNPLVLFDGQPTGVAEGEPNSADNAQTIDLTSFTVSNFRCDPSICDGIPGDPSLDCDDDGLFDACEIALGLDTDINDNDVPDSCERPENDDCGFAPLIFAGTLPFTTEVATTDGPDEPGCGPLERDVWFRFIDTCTAGVTVRVRDADFPVQLAVYSACPDAPGESLACDGGTGGAAEVTLTLPVGLYRIRVGSADGSVGRGVLELSCALPSCPGDGNADGVVDDADLAALLTAWGTGEPLYDLVLDGVVNVRDLLALLAAWGPCPE